MKTPYGLKAPKRDNNLSINKDLVDDSNPLNINALSISDSALTEQQTKQWKVANRSAIQTYNEFIEVNGCFSDEYRSFNISPHRSMQR